MSARGRVRKEGPVGIDTFETLSERMTAVRILDRKFQFENGAACGLFLFACYVQNPDIKR